MTKALIILPSTSRFNPARLGAFLWNDEHECHLWDGRPLELEEFNRVSKHLFYERRDEIVEFDLPPYVQLVETVDEPAPVPATISAPPTPRQKREGKPKVPKMEITL